MTSTVPHLACPTSIRQSNADHKKLRTACDSCHQCKVKCSGGSPCYRCTSKGLYCRYSYQNRAGKPKGSKNRRTLEREHQLRMERLAGQLRNGNRDFDNSNLDMLDLSTLLPDSWEQTSTSRFSIPSSDQSTPENQWINSTESENELLPLLDDLDTWEMDLDPTLRTPRDLTSQSIEAIMTPMSFTGRTDLRQLSDSTDPISFGLPSPPSPARQDTPGDPCACVQTQATNISTLHQLTCRDIPSRFDLAMKSITSALETCEKFITCEVCDKSFPSILLTLSAIELIFKLFEQLTKNNEGLLQSEEQHLVSCSLGDYKVTKQESQAIQNVLVKMTLSKGRETLDALQSLVGPVGVPEEQDESEFTRRNSTGPLCCTDQEYMIQYIKRRKTALEELIAAVGA